MNTTPNPDLFASVNLVGHILTIDYRVRNQTTQILYLFNKIYYDIDDNGRYIVQPNLCVIEIKDGSVHVGKKIAELPLLSFVERLNIPCVSEVNPGENFQERITLTTPLRQWSPYHEFENDAKESAGQEMPLYFEVGYFYGVAGTRDLATRVLTTIGELQQFDPFPITSQRIAAVGPLGQPVQVLL